MYIQCHILLHLGARHMLHLAPMPQETFFLGCALRLLNYVHNIVNKCCMIGGVFYETIGKCGSTLMWAWCNKCWMVSLFVGSLRRIS